MPVSPSRPVSPRDLRDVLLVFLTVGSGAVDAISYLGLGRVFTALMSGNVILLGLAVGRAETSEAARSAVSLAAFASGVLVASWLGRSGRGDEAWPLSVTIALVLEVVAQAGLLVGWLIVAGRPGPGFEAGLVAASGLAMGLQSGAVAVLGVSGVSTTYVTGTLTGLLRELATGSGWRRSVVRRALVLLALLVGAGCGALLLHHARRLAPALPLAVTLLAVTAAVRGPVRSGEKQPTL